MQGTTLSIEVGGGNEVEPDDTVYVLEVTKMGNGIVAGHDGTASQVLVSEDDSVGMGDVLLVLK